MAKIAKFAIKLLAFKARSFERSTFDPAACQKALLTEYLSRNKDTDYGRKYRFSGIKTVADYQRTVPVSDCETVRPYIERMIKGERRVLTADDPIFFGLTSGTTSHPKFIPVTEYSRRKKAEVADIWAYYIARDHPRVLDGKILAVVNPDKEGVTASGVPYGAETGHGYKNLPAVVRGLYALPPEVFEIADYDKRYYCMMRIAAEQNVTTVATLNPTTLVLLSQKLELWRDSIIKDVEDGSIDPNLDIDPEVRARLEKRLKPNPVRAVQLRRIVNDKMGFLPKHVWPGLEVIECWKAGTMKLYLKELSEYFGEIPVRDFGCLSTEARSSIPMSDEGAGGALAIRTNFYEFIPKEEISSPDRRMLLCTEIEKGREYFIVVTTPGGLYRYNIDDIIRVDGFLNRTPVIEFVQKGLNAVSVMGEKVYESHINEAINAAAKTLDVLIKFFSATVQRDRVPRYVFLVEFNGRVDKDVKRELLRHIEKELSRQNAEYLYTRNIQVLAAPILKVVRNGSFEKYRDRRVNAGVHDTQFKAPELTADPDFQKNFEIEEEIQL